MSYQEERKFITYLTNINLRALLVSDLRGSTEQHSQNHSPHQSFHISPTHTVSPDLQRISWATRRRYGAEGNTGKYGISDLDLFRLGFCLSLRWQWQLLLQPGFLFSWLFFQTTRIYKLWTSPSLMLSKSSSIPCQHTVLLGFLPYRRWEFNSHAESPGGCPGAGQAPSELQAGGLGCCVQDALGHGGAAVGRHLYCAPCAATTRAGGMCRLLSSLVHFSLSWAIASTTPLASSTVQKGPNAGYMSVPVVTPS